MTRILKAAPSDSKQRSVDAKRQRLIQKARKAFSALTAPEQAILFREFSRCACAEIGKITAKSPAAAVGAIAGGLLGLFLDGNNKDKK